MRVRVCVKPRDHLLSFYSRVPSSRFNAEEVSREWSSIIVVVVVVIVVAVVAVVVHSTVEDIQRSQSK